MDSENTQPLLNLYAKRGTADGYGYERIQRKTSQLAK
jgi:hypothetical protein